MWDIYNFMGYIYSAWALVVYVKKIKKVTAQDELLTIWVQSTHIFLQNLDFWGCVGAFAAV